MSIILTIAIHYSGNNIIDKTKHRPRKRFGQNFLQNNTIIANILALIHPQHNDTMIEIGPGLGALTRPLLAHVARLHAIEIDNDLFARLQTWPEADRLYLIHADALSINYGQFGQNIRVVGNLPYNISTPLILHLLAYRDYIQDMHFMLQKEVVDRLAASPGCKTYGRLSAMVQYYCEVHALLDVPPEAFYPQPKVNSAIVRLTPRNTLPYPDLDFSTLEKVVAMAFSMRRKTIANTLKPLFDEKTLRMFDIDPTQRAETISPSKYAQLAKFISK